MPWILQTLLSALLGAVLAVFGTLHSLHAFPAPLAWQAVAATASQLGAVLLFLLGVLGATTGVLMVVTSLVRIRRQFGHRRHDAAYLHGRHPDEQFHDEPHEPVWR